MATLRRPILVIAVFFAGLLSAAESLAGQNVLLGFQADWCGACRQVQPLVRQLQADGWPIQMIDVDRQASLARQFRIRSLPTFVLVVDGQEADRAVGAIGESQLRGMLARIRAGGSLSASSAGLTLPERSIPPRRDGRSAQPLPFSLRETEIATSAEPGWSSRHERIRGRSSSVASNRSSAISVAEGSRSLTAPYRDSNAADSVVPASFDRSPATGLVQTLASSAVAPESHRSAGDPLRVSVRISVVEGDGQAVGSGTIIHSEPGNAIVLTCGHIFRGTSGRRPVIVDVFLPQGRMRYQGRVLSYDLEADVGLVQIASAEVLPAVPVAPRGYRLQPGMPVANVGCSHGAAPSLKSCQLTAVDRYLGPPNLECTGIPVQGRSGGGLFGPDGYVIGVCIAADPSEGRGLYAGLRAVQHQLDRMNLTALYERPGSDSALAQNSWPSDRGPHGTPEQGATTFAPAETHTLAELLDDMEEAEVICVIRPLKDPRARSRVVVLDRASQGFLAQLAREHRLQQSRHLTSLEIPNERPDRDVPQTRRPRPTVQPLLRVPIGALASGS